MILVIILIINHVQAALGKVLILSRGKDEFSFGPASSPTTFDKKDIREIFTYGRRYRGGYAALTKVEIHFTDDRIIDISCLLIRYEDLAAKFPNCQQTVIPTTFPFFVSSQAAL